MGLLSLSFRTMPISLWVHLRKCCQIKYLSLQRGQWPWMIDEDAPVSVTIKTAAPSILTGRVLNLTPWVPSGDCWWRPTSQYVSFLARPAFPVCSSYDKHDQRRRWLRHGPRSMRYISGMFAFLRCFMVGFSGLAGVLNTLWPSGDRWSQVNGGCLMATGREAMPIVKHIRIRMCRQATHFLTISSLSSEENMHFFSSNVPLEIDNFPSLQRWNLLKLRFHKRVMRKRYALCVSDNKWITCNRRSVIPYACVRFS